MLLFNFISREKAIKFETFVWVYDKKLQLIISHLLQQKPFVFARNIRTCPQFCFLLILKKKEKKVNRSLLSIFKGFHFRSIFLIIKSLFSLNNNNNKQCMMRLKIILRIIKTTVIIIIICCCCFNNSNNAAKYFIRFHIFFRFQEYKISNAHFCKKYLYNECLVMIVLGINILINVLVLYNYNNAIK